MKDKIISLVLSSENLDKAEIVTRLKEIIREKHKQDQDEAKDLELILNTNGRICCLPSICVKNCNDCKVDVKANVDAHL